MEIVRFSFNPFLENTYLVYNEEAQAVLIDPGFSNSSEEKKLYNFIEHNRLNIMDILLTHAHIDHILGLHRSVELFGCSPHLHENEKQIFDQGEGAARMFEFSYLPYLGTWNIIKKGDRFLRSGIGEIRLIHTPGHSPGSVCFYFEKEKFIISGDVLFLGSIGRTDLPGGHFETLIHSIEHNLFSLPREIKVYPGHGESTHIGYEKEYNPFLRGM